MRNPLWTYCLTTLLWTVPLCGVLGQERIQVQVEAGQHNASAGLFVRSLARGAYNPGPYRFEAGVQLDLKSNNPRTFSGLDLGISREFLAGAFPFTLKAFFMLNRFSEILFETNWGATASTGKLEHWLFEIGTSFKTYSVNSSFTGPSASDGSGRSLHENFNLVYTITAYLKPRNHPWNIGLACTNLDYYLVNQSTNPFFNLQGRYRTEKGLTFLLESWYKQAGMLNISANHFGYFFRGGIAWEF